MTGLFKVANVQRGDGRWSVGYDERSACGVAVSVADPCDTGNPIVVGGDPNPVEPRRIHPFGIEALTTRPLRCMDSDRVLAAERIEAASEYACEWVLWYGITGHVDLSIEGSADSVPTRGTTPIGPIAAALEAQSKRIPGVAPRTLLLGAEHALGLSSGTWKALEEMSIGVVVSSAFPHDAIAVLGPIEIHLGSVESSDHFDPATNGGSVVATRIASIEFDPCAAFRVT